MAEHDQGWEQPKTRGRRLKKKKASSASGHPADEATRIILWDARPTGIMEGLTLSKLIGDLGKLEKRWAETDCARHVRDILQKRTWDVSEAVCIGIGSFSADWENRYRSMWQLVLFRDVVKGVSRRNPAIRVYAQEPDFSDLDKAFLGVLGITVLEDDVEMHISPSSFVYAPFVDWNLLLSRFLKNKDPLLYVGNEILDDYGMFTGSDRHEEALPECNEIGKLFLESRWTAKLSDFALHPHALSGLMVYWRKDVGEGGKE